MGLLRATFAPFLTRQFLVFLAVGGTCALANFGSGAAVRALSTGRFAYAGSVIVGFTVGTVLSFVLNRRFTFAATNQPAGQQAFRFGLVALTSVVLSAGIAEVALKLIQLVLGGSSSQGAMESLAHLVSIGVITIYNFVAIKFFAMRPAAERAESPPTD